MPARLMLVTCFTVSPFVLPKLASDFGFSLELSSDELE